jgi:hypothetical protein
MSNKLNHYKYYIMQTLQKPTKETIEAIDLSAQHQLTVSGRSVEFLNGEPGKEHYKLLAWISTQFKSSKITEVGTLDGCGALALSYNDNNQVTTWDIRFYDDCAKFPTNVQRNIVTMNYLTEVAKSKVIFYDTMHDGIMEFQFIAALIAFKWKGVLILDDIYLYECMTTMWNDIPLRKEDWTDIGHHSGTGIVFFD